MPLQLQKANMSPLDDGSGGSSDGPSVHAGDWKQMDGAEWLSQAT
jgi:hypothetical protein